MAFSDWRIIRRLVTGVSGSRHRTLTQLSLFAITVIIYSLLFGIVVGVALSSILLLHELGHLAMVKAFGIRHEGVLFIPLIGAGVVAEYPKTRLSDAIIAAAGPTAGVISSIAFLLVGEWRNESAWALLAFAAATVNLVNLIPSQSYDGGSIIRSAISSLPTATSRLAVLTTSWAVMAVAVTTALLTGNWFTSIILVIFAVLMPKTAKSFIAKTERLEDLAASLDVEPKKSLVEARIAKYLMAEADNEVRSMDDDESLHDILGIEPGSFNNEAQARKRVAEKLDFSLHEDQTPMTATQARLALAGYVALVIALTVVSHLSLSSPGEPRVFLGLFGGLAGLIIN